uniref:Uncharacterized protein n=1 Tax=Lutzomyia longipalpis TaxID=7200 RepID=A0A1B0CI73_LUTLO
MELFLDKRYKSKLPKELQDLNDLEKKPRQDDVAATLNPEVDPLSNIKELSSYIEQLDHPPLKLPIEKLPNYPEVLDDDLSNLRVPSPPILGAADIQKVENKAMDPEAAGMACSSNYRQAMQAYNRGLLDRTRMNTQTEVELFGQFVVKMLRKMNEPSRFATMSKMSSILFENILSSGFVNTEGNAGNGGNGGNGGTNGASGVNGDGGDGDVAMSMIDALISKHESN